MKQQITHHGIKHNAQSRQNKLKLSKEKGFYHQFYKTQSAKQQVSEDEELNPLMVEQSPPRTATPHDAFFSLGPQQTTGPTLTVDDGFVKTIQVPTSKFESSPIRAEDTPSLATTGKKQRLGSAMSVSRMSRRVQSPQSSVMGSQMSYAQTNNPIKDVLMCSCACKQKLAGFLKKEIDDFRNLKSAFKYNRKELVMKMMLDEIETSKKRIGVLEEKHRQQKQTIAQLEDALYVNNSHRLLLRCTGQKFPQRSTSSRIFVGRKSQKNNQFMQDLVGDQKIIEEDQENTERNSPVKDQEIIQEPETIQEPEIVIPDPPLDPRGSLVNIREFLKGGVDRLQLHQQICPEAAPFQSKQNSLWFINDFNSLLHLYQSHQQITDYESDTVNSDFLKILDDFEKKGRKLLKCEGIKLMMIDEENNRLIQFKGKEIEKHSIESVITAPFTDKSMVYNESSQCELYFNKGKVSEMLDTVDIHSIIATKIQAYGKNAAIIAANQYIDQFTSSELELIQALGSACLRKLSRERELDHHMRLIWAYKSLLKASVNLASHYHLGRLMKDAEKRLSNLLHVNNILILVINHKDQTFSKLKSKQSIQQSGSAEDNELTQIGDIPLSIVQMEGLAQIAIDRKKVMLVTEPLSYVEYNPDIDLAFNCKQKVEPIVCIPIMDRNCENIEGCIQVEYKQRSYLTGNPLETNFKDPDAQEFRLDVVQKEVLEIFSNILRTCIERVNKVNEYREKLIVAGEKKYTNPWDFHEQNS